MNTSKVTRLLLLFEREERKQLRYFLASPYHNRDENCVQLYAFIEAEIIEKRNEVEDEVVAKRFFPDIKGADKQKNRLNQLKSKLLNLVHDFLGMEAIRANKALLREFTLEGLLESKEAMGYEKLYQDLLNMLEKGGFHGSEYHFWRYRVLRSQSEYLNLKVKRKILENLPQALLELERFYQIERLIVTCRMLSQQRIFGEISSVSAILDLEALENLSDDLLIQAYLRVYRMLTADLPEADAAYASLKEILENAHKVIDPRDLEDIYAFALNYAIRRNREGAPGFDKDLIRMYPAKTELMKQLGQGKIHARDFKNIGAMMCSQGQYSWVIDFCDSMRGRLIGDYRDNTINFVRGMVFQAQKDYQSAKKMYQAILRDFRDQFNHIGTRVRLQAIHYIVDDYTSFLYGFDALRVFLTRITAAKRMENRLSPAHIAAFKNFNANLRRLFDQRRSGELKVKKLQKLYDQIANEKHLEFRPWLLNQTQVLLDEARGD